MKEISQSKTWTQLNPPILGEELFIGSIKEKRYETTDNTVQH